MINGSNMGQALIGYIKVETLEDLLEEIGLSLGDPLCLDSHIYPKMLYLGLSLFPFRDGFSLLGTRPP